MDNDKALRILGLKGGESYEEIRRAFRKMVLQYHPDRYQNFSQQAWATKRFIKIKEAYDFLVSQQTFIMNNSGLHYDTSQDFNWSNEQSSPFSLFDWLADKLPKEDTILSLIISIPFGILFMFGLAPYGFILDIFQSVFEKLGLDPYPDSCSRKGRFSFLIISTLAASIYFPNFFYLVYTGSKYSLAVRMGVGFILSSFVVIFVASEWIGFFLSEIWRRSVENEIKTYLPMTREKTI